MQEGAIRETQEEAGATVEIEHIYTMFDLPYISQIYMFFKANLVSFDFQPSSETLEARLFDEDEIPWEALAFKVVEQTLRSYFKDRKVGEFPFRHETIRHPTLRRIEAASS